MKKIALLVSCVVLAACASTGESDESRREAATAVRDFIEVNELESLTSIRTSDTLALHDLNDTFILVSTKRQSFLLEYYSRCYQYTDGGVAPDVRRDARRIYARADTMRGCRIKALYSLEPGQADELREIGRSVGGDRLSW